MACSDKYTEGESASHYLMYKILFSPFDRICRIKATTYFFSLSVPNSMFFFFSFTFAYLNIVHQNNKLTLLLFIFYWIPLILFFPRVYIIMILRRLLFSTGFFYDCDCACVYFAVVVLLSYRFTIKQVVVVLVFPGEFPHCI